MILVQPPTTTTTTIETIEMNGTRHPLAGKTSIENVKIVCPDKISGSKDDVWDKLKYGVMPDLADA